MKAVRLVEIGKPLQMQDIPTPDVGDYDVLVRVKAAGICHSDAHYRAGNSAVGPLPQTLGHEVAGVVERVGAQVSGVKAGDRVCLHYLLTCGSCYYCSLGSEQFCASASMIGKYCDGGYAEAIAVPGRNAIPLPDEISFEQGAVLMCSAATSFHALRKTRLAPGETVAVFGAGGLGMAAIQLAGALGALNIYAIDVSPEKLRLARKYGAIPINAAADDPVAALQELTGGRGVDVALELVGLPVTMQQSVRSLAIFGRAGLVGISPRPFAVDSYSEILGKETEIIGCADHLLHEMPLLLELARRGALNFSDALLSTIPLDADAINDTLDALENFGADVRTVIVP